VIFVTKFHICVAKNSEFLQKEADDILKKINNSISICDDFYEYACGKYRPEIPPHKVKIDELDLIKDTLQEQLNEVFKSTASDDDSDSIKNVKTFYTNCMNTGDEK
jgi:predicted metalloendopeptidase